MSLAMTVFVSGVMGVLIVMVFLQITLNLTSKIVIALEKKDSSEKE